MRDLDIFSMAEHCVLSKIALFEVQEAPIVAHAYVGSASKLFPWMLQESEFIEVGVVKVITEIDMHGTAGKSRQRRLVIKGVDDEQSAHSTSIHTSHTPPLQDLLRHLPGAKPGGHVFAKTFLAPLVYQR